MSTRPSGAVSTKISWISDEISLHFSEFSGSRKLLGGGVFPDSESIRQFWQDLFEEEFVCIENDSKYGSRPLIHMFLTKVTS